MSGYVGVRQLALQSPDWLPVVRAALTTAETTGNRFAGAWVVDEFERIKWPGMAYGGVYGGTRVTMVPGLRKLTTFDILEKDGPSTRQGRRAYYRMPDPDGVRRALEELGFLTPRLT